MNHLIYLAHGGQGYRNECRFSLLKSLHVHNGQLPPHTAVVICTDRPEEFEPFRPFLPALHLEVVNEALLQEWIAGTGYVHRAKTKMIQHVLGKYGGNVLFLDTDAYLTQPLNDVWAGIGAGTVYLHLAEGVLDRRRNREFRKWDRFLQSADLPYGNRRFVYDRNMLIWNSGAFGLSEQHLPLLEEVVQLIDAIVAQFPKHITEQVAVSYCFRHLPLKPLGSRVAHYWNLKEFREVLADFFATHAGEEIPALVEKAQLLDPMALMRQKLDDRNRPFWQRWWRKMAGSQWRIEPYRTKP